MNIKSKSLFTLFFIIIFALGIYFSTKWGVKARMFPQLIAIAGLAMAVWNLIKETFFERLKVESQSKPEKAKTETDQAAKKQKATPKSEAIMVMWVLIYFCMVLLLGFWVSIIAFTALFMTGFGRENWKTVTIYSIAMWILVYVTFDMGMQASLYGGIFEIGW